MNYLLDTCVISELVKPAADENVTSWISDGPEETIHLSVITIGEIQKGITKLPASAKKHQLQSWNLVMFWTSLARRLGWKYSVASWDTLK